MGAILLYPDAAGRWSDALLERLDGIIVSRVMSLTGHTT